MARKEPRISWHEGNRIDLLQNGAEFFPALCDAIDAAQSRVHLETYIFNLDNTGRRVLECLRRARERGVRVRVVIDGFGSEVHAQEIMRCLADMGAQCRVYRPKPKSVLSYRFNLRPLRRMHRKVAVIDDSMAFLGGINILDDLEDVPTDGPGPRPRFDFAVRLQGPIVIDVNVAQSSLWLRFSWRRRDDWASFSRRVGALFKRRSQHQMDSISSFHPGLRAVLLLRDNVRFRQTIENVYLDAIAHARDEILIANAYFFPGRRLRQALEHAAARGVRVRLLLQGRSEYPLQYRACRSMYGKLLDDGIEIYEYLASYLHAKVAVIDTYAMVGSSNLDPFSLLLAREANVYVDDAEFSHRLQASVEAEIKNNAQLVTQESMQERSFLGRCLDNFSYLMLRVGVALTGKSSLY